MKRRFTLITLLLLLGLMLAACGGETPEETPVPAETRVTEVESSGTEEEPMEEEATEEPMEEMGNDLGGREMQPDQQFSQAVSTVDGDGLRVPEWFLYHVDRQVVPGHGDLAFSLQPFVENLHLDIVFPVIAALTFLTFGQQGHYQLAGHVFSSCSNQQRLPAGEDTPSTKKSHPAIGSQLIQSTFFGLTRFLACVFTMSK